MYQFAISLQLVGLLAVIARAILIFRREHSIPRMILSAWLWIFVWSIVCCMIAPLVFYKLGYSDAFNVFPEMTGITGMGLVGWILGIYISIPILLSRAGRWTFRAIRRDKK